jgi:hypothetical protein
VDRVFGDPVTFFVVSRRKIRPGWLDVLRNHRKEWRRKKGLKSERGDSKPLQRCKINAFRDARDGVRPSRAHEFKTRPAFFRGRLASRLEPPQIARA